MSNLNKKTATGFWIPIRVFLILLGLSLATCTLIGSYLMSIIIPASAMNEITVTKDQMIIYQEEAVPEKEKGAIDSWLAKKQLNQYGDPQGTVYKSDPLYNSQVGDRWNRYQYLRNKFPQRPWQ